MEDKKDTPYATVPNPDAPSRFIIGRGPHWVDDTAATFAEAQKKQRYYQEMAEASARALAARNDSSFRPEMVAKIRIWRAAPEYYECLPVAE